MTPTLQPSSRRFRNGANVTPLQERRLNKRRRWLGWGAMLIMAGYVLFSHGCHWGDEDTELHLHAPAPVAGPATDG